MGSWGRAPTVALPLGKQPLSGPRGPSRTLPRPSLSSRPLPSRAPKGSLSGGPAGCLSRSPGRAPWLPTAFSGPSPCVGHRPFHWAVNVSLAHSVGAPPNTRTHPPSAPSRAGTQFLREQHHIGLGGLFRTCRQQQQTPRPACGDRVGRQQRDIPASPVLQVRQLASNRAEPGPRPQH